MRRSFQLPFWLSARLDRHHTGASKASTQQAANTERTIDHELVLHQSLAQYIVPVLVRSALTTTEELVHPFQGQLNALHGSGITETQVAITVVSKGMAWQTGNTGFHQHSFGQIC